MFAKSFFDLVMMLVANAGTAAPRRVNTLLLGLRVPADRGAHRRSDASAYCAPEAALHHLHRRQRGRSYSPALAEIPRPRHMPKRAIGRRNELRNRVGEAHCVANRVHRVG